MGRLYISLGAEDPDDRNRSDEKFYRTVGANRPRDVYPYGENAHHWLSYLLGRQAIDNLKHHYDLTKDEPGKLFRPIFNEYREKEQAWMSRVGKQLFQDLDLYRAGIVGQTVIDKIPNITINNWEIVKAGVDALDADNLKCAFSCLPPEAGNTIFYEAIKYAVRLYGQYHRRGVDTDRPTSVLMLPSLKIDKAYAEGIRNFLDFAVEVIPVENIV